MVNSLGSFLWRKRFPKKSGGWGDDWQLCRKFHQIIMTKMLNIHFAI